MQYQRKSRKDSSMTRLLASLRTRLRPAVFLLTAWVALLWVAGGAAAGADGGLLGRLATSLSRRFTEARTTRDAGLTTVEVAIITAVLLGLATALVAAITVVVNRNTSKIQ